MLLLWKAAQSLADTGPGGDVVLPASATAVADYAFAGNAAISSVTIPANVTSVGSYAFQAVQG